LNEVTETPNRKAIIAEVEGGRLTSLSTRSLNQPLGPHIQVVHSLGPLVQEESFALLMAVDGSDQVRKNRINALGFHDQIPAAAREIESALGADSSEEVRKSAAYALARHQSVEALNRLTRTALRDASVAVARAAAYAIGTIEAEASVEALRGVLDGSDRREVRKASAHALGNLGLESARALLIHLIRTEQ
ncbi:MAG: hypothetical protein HKN29_06720, partial [Rhodothermales bacterium]|nr:hypothetical protein [Rhodothermales bacterium]